MFLSLPIDHFTALFLCDASLAQQPVALMPESCLIVLGPSRPTPALTSSTSPTTTLSTASPTYPEEGKALQERVWRELRVVLEGIREGVTAL